MRELAIMLAVAAALGGALWLASPEHAAAPLEPAPRRVELEIALAASVLEAQETPEEREACVEPPAPPRSDPAAAIRDLLATSVGPQWVSGARANAAELDAQAVAALERSAASPSTPPLERCAAAELLRHAPAAMLPAQALAFLRESFEAREQEPLLALAAVRALAAFGESADRARLLEAAPSSSLALAGLSCMRGDEAAHELAAAARESADARRAELALAALASMAASDEGGLTPRGRAECAAELDSAFGDARDARRLCALAALDPRLAAR